MKSESRAATLLLIDGLHHDPPRWRASIVKNGSCNPLAKAGVIVHQKNLRPLDRCPGCDECDDQPPPFIDEEDGKPYFTCPMDGQCTPLSWDAIGDWALDGDRLAELISDAMDCECAESTNSGRLWNLGITRFPLDKVASREICVATVLYGETDAILKECPQGTRHLLFVGHLEGKITNEQFNRRIFTFDRILRFLPDGKLEINFEEIKGQLSEKLSAKDNLTKPLNPVTRKIANYCAKQTFALLTIKDFYELEKAMNELSKITGKASEIGVAKSSISQTLNLKGKNAQYDPCAQFWYDHMTRSCEFEHFRYAAKKHPVGNKEIDAEKLYPIYQKLIIASMGIDAGYNPRRG